MSLRHLAIANNEMSGLGAVVNDGVDSVIFSILAMLGSIEDPRRLSREQLEESDRNGQRLLNDYAAAAVARGTANKARAKKARELGKFHEFMRTNAAPRPRFKGR